jgi:hypothetical protein
VKFIILELSYIFSCYWTAEEIHMTVKNFSINENIAKYKNKEILGVYKFLSYFQK